MTNKLKRLLALSFVVVLILGLIACGKEDSETTSDLTTTSSASSEGSSSSDDTTTTKSGATTKANGKTTVKATSAVQTITDAQGYSKISPLIERTTNNRGNASASFINGLKGYELEIFYPWELQKQESTLGQSAAYARQEVEKEFGVTIKEDGVWASYNENLAAKLTSRSCDAQIYMAQDFNYASYFKNQYLSDLTNAMSKAAVDFKDPWYNQNASAFLNINYKQYGWIAYDMQSEYVFPYVIIYNKTLIDDARLTDPATLAEQGKWTWDTLQTYAKRLTNTSKGVTGFATIDATQMLASMVAQKGNSLVQVSKGSTPAPNIENQTVKECLSTLVNWCGDGGICETWSNQSWTYPKTQFAKGKVAMIYGFHDTIKQLNSSGTVNNEFGLVQFPMPTESKTYINVSIPQFVNFIPSQYQNEAPEILFLRNELYRQNYRFIQRDFQVLWKDYFTDTDVLSYACNIKFERGNNETVMDWRSVAEETGVGKTSTTTVVKEAISTKSVQSAIDKYKSGLQKNYETVWEGYKITGNV